MINEALEKNALSVAIVMSTVIMLAVVVYIDVDLNSKIAELTLAVKGSGTGSLDAGSGSGSGNGTGTTEPIGTGAAPSAGAIDMKALADDDSVKGNSDAVVTIVEFSDFQCTFCKRFYDNALGQIRSTYIDTGKVKFVYRDFPLGFHQNAQIAAEAAECAGEQGKFWEYHDKIFDNSQSDGTGLYKDDLKQYAAELGLDAAAFNTCIDSGKYTQEVNDDFNDGSAAGVDGTPTFFINGTKIVGAQPFSNFQQIIDAELNR